MSPLVRGRLALRRRIRVDLPAPLRPTMQTNCPSGIVNERSARAVCPFGKVFRTLRTSIVAIEARVSGPIVIGHSTFD
jgi:hypothetical protein